MWFDFPVAHVDDGNLIHLNAPLAIFRVDTEHSGSVLTNAEIVAGQFTRHASSLLSQYFAEFYYAGTCFF
jgi:hypothetical protein